MLSVSCKCAVSVLSPLALKSWRVTLVPVKACNFLFGVVALHLTFGTTDLPILGDPGAVSRVRRKGGMKVFKYRRKSPWVPTFTKLFSNIQADAAS